MKKVLLLTHEYYPFAGGIANYCYNLFKNFPIKNYIVVSDNYELEQKGNFFKVKLLSTHIWPHWLPGLLVLIKLVKKHKIEVIFTPNILPLGSLAYMIKKMFGLPYILSLHGLDINLALQNKAAWTKRILNSAQYIVCNTQYTSNLINKIVDPNKIVVIYPNVTLNNKQVDPDVLQKLRNFYHLDDSKIILTVGRLVVRKGHGLVIAALKEITDIDCKYLIVGDGPNRSALEKQVKDYNLGHRVIFAGKVLESEKLSAIYQLANVFAMPNQVIGGDVEGFGMVFLEAASFHLPIIAGHSGGVGEIFSGLDDVYFVDNIDGVVAGLRDLLLDPSKANHYGSQAFLRSEEFKNKQNQNIKLLEKILS